MFGGYNPQKKDIPIFINRLARNINHYINRYDNMLIFCDLRSLKNLINESTCFKNPNNPSIIDDHKMVITVLKGFFHKQAPRLIKYRNCKKLNQDQFNNELKEKLNFIKKVYNKL